MKNLITLFLILATSFTGQAQHQKIEHCNCPELEPIDFQRMCRLTKDKTRAIEPSDFTFQFEQEIIRMSCVDLKKDSRETIIFKVNCMWNKYKTKFKCDLLGFNVLNGNLLKFSMNFNFPDFIYLMGENYNVDFLFFDPADGKTILDYLDHEITKLSKYNNPPKEKLKEMEEIKKFILEERKYNSKEQMFEVVK